MLSKKALSLVEDSSHEICVSVITFWELAIKKSVGKIDLGSVRVEQMLGLAEQSNFIILELSPSLAATSYKLPWFVGHRDPFDRMLIWKALQKDFTIISKDASFHLYSDLGLKLIW